MMVNGRLCSKCINVHPPADRRCLDTGLLVGNLGLLIGLFKLKGVDVHEILLVNYFWWVFLMED